MPSCRKASQQITVKFLCLTKYHAMDTYGGMDNEEALHKEELCNLYSSPSIVITVK